MIIIHFDDPKTLKDWLDSPKRAEWLAKIPGEIRDFRLKTLPSGFGAWFAGTVEGSAVPLPPKWKMALTILLTLYPTVMLLAIFVGPHINPLGLAVSMLVEQHPERRHPPVDRATGARPRAWPLAARNEGKQRAYSLGGLAVLLSC